jgi:hypothetical protein
VYSPTGGPLRSCANAGSPCARAVALAGGPFHTRQSWDPIAVLAAVRGAAHPSLRVVALGGGGASNRVDGAGANFWTDRVLHRAESVGVWGGACVCPSGGAYWAGDNGDQCGSLACEGGAAGECVRRFGEWSFNRVVCASLTPAELSAAAERTQRGATSVYLKLRGEGWSAADEAEAKGALREEMDELLCRPPRYGAASG